MTAPTPERRVGEARLNAIGYHSRGISFEYLEQGETPDGFKTVIHSEEARNIARDLLDERAANALLTAEVERLTGIELKYRKSLWMGHGHDHLYGDDGEMQCTQCPGEAWDYRRAPLEVIERAAWFARTTSLPTPAPEATEAECPDCEGNGFTLRSVNECCGHGTPSGECCGDPVEGQEQVGCERCQTTGKVATPPAPEDTDG